MRHYKIFLLLPLLFAACNTIDVFEKTTAIPHHEWSSNNKLNFNFTAKDSTAYYNIYFVIRHTESYHFNNIWINITSSAPGKKTETQRLNITLANVNGWLGSAMDDIIEQRILLFSQPIKLQTGDYHFSIQQIMREDPLLNVLNAGIRVEKVVQ
ncbi:MAG: gliding motility lipoprotein GldH [Bacteroidetes bacterium]|nr:gliding motility lipoprotein GldH [Bacteroidota bacterium]